jgi:hypothetical protein
MKGARGAIIFHAVRAFYRLLQAALQRDRILKLPAKARSR